LLVAVWIVVAADIRFFIQPGLLPSLVGMNMDMRCSLTVHALFLMMMCANDSPSLMNWVILGFT